MSLIAVRKQLQKELAALTHQAGRITTALAALNGKERATGRRTLSAARRKASIISLKKARAAKAAKARSNK